jgi:hypothetical protein
MSRILLGLLTLVIFTQLAVAATAEKTKEKPAITKQNDGTGQDHNFEDLLVQGKYHFSDEAVTTVEEDKVLDSLLGIRADFKDRMEKSAGQY